MSPIPPAAGSMPSEDTTAATTCRRSRRTIRLRTPGPHRTPEAPASIHRSMRVRHGWVQPGINERTLLGRDVRPGPPDRGMGGSLLGPSDREGGSIPLEDDRDTWCCRLSCLCRRTPVNAAAYPAPPKPAVSGGPTMAGRRGVHSPYADDKWEPDRRRSPLTLQPCPRKDKFGGPARLGF